MRNAADRSASLSSPNLEAGVRSRPPQRFHLSVHGLSAHDMNAEFPELFRAVLVYEDIYSNELALNHGAVFEYNSAGQLSSIRQCYNRSRLKERTSYVGASYYRNDTWTDKFTSLELFI